MWARAIEFMLGLWVVISPFVFLREPGSLSIQATAFSCGLLICLFSAMSFWSRTRRAHLLELLVAAWLVGYGYLAGGYPSAPVFQSFMLTGLTLVLFAIIPPEANAPPRKWRQHYEQRARMLER
jgi:peptidoglycan/LPS O-acetylase OafA/YrhL